MITGFLERGAVAAMAGRCRGGERGAQSLEWVALGGLVSTALGAAAHMAGSDGFGTDLAKSILHPVLAMINGK